MRPLYVTTPIYYVNDKPHLGTAYSTIAADALVRYAKLRGKHTRFLTGLDEHGQKIERRAKDEGLTPQEYCDRMVPPFREAWELLGCAHDDLIRTTEPRHESRVRALWERCVASGDIYLGHYEGWYCVADEAFYTEKELVDGKSPTGRPVERVKEPSYFFRLSAYTDRLLAYYEAHPDFVKPEGRFNEVRSFVKQGLQDLSISRTTFRWGVPVPGDPEHVMYVWFDALANYLTALGGPEETPLVSTFWPPHGDTVHLVGKDILRFHAVFWPAFLMSAGLAPPTQVWAHGWLTVNGEKMSKSAGNFLAPGPIADAVGADVLRYYLLRDIALGQDGDFSATSLLARYQGELGNGLGNLLNRLVATILQKNFDGRVPTPGALTDLDRELVATAERAAAESAKHWDHVAPNKALEAAWELVLAANKYVDQTAPWALVKSGDTARLATVSYVVLEALRWLATMLWPVLPEKCDALRAQLGLGKQLPIEGLDLWPSAWGGLVAGTSTRPGAPLFPRLDEAQERIALERMGVKLDAPKLAEPATKKLEKTPESAPKPPESASADGNITIDELSKIQLRLALVLRAERVPKSDKLLRLEVDAGDGAPRQILAGIGKTYAPEDLVGKRLVVVANLAPRKLMGLESRGMVLAASDDSGLSALFVDKDIAPGSAVK